jgi:hypothetical protein
LSRRLFGGSLSPVAKAFRHPIVVGATLALLSGLLASLLIPALTRVWQDRPKELALKRELVERISSDATEAVDEARLNYVAFQKRGLTIAGANALLLHMTRRWEVKSSIITAELTTYFRDTVLLRHWRRYAALVPRYIRSSVGLNVREFEGSPDPDLPVLVEHFGGRRAVFGRETKMKSKDFSPLEERALVVHYLPQLFFRERDNLLDGVVDTPASGFSHGWWIFK